MEKTKGQAKEYLSFCYAVSFYLRSIINVLNLPQLLQSWHLCAVQVWQLEHSQHLHKKAHYWGQIHVVCGSFLAFPWLRPALQYFGTAVHCIECFLLYSLVKAELHWTPLNWTTLNQGWTLHSHDNKIFCLIFKMEMHEIALCNYGEDVSLIQQWRYVDTLLKLPQTKAVYCLCCAFGRIYKIILLLTWLLTACIIGCQ